MRMTCIWASLVLLGSLVDARAAQGDAPLLDAVRAGDTAAVRALLGQGADVNAAEADGTTALHWASYRDDATTVELLLSAGADVEAANQYGARPLSLASAGGYTQTLAALLEAGADPTLMTAGVPPILSAARTGNVDAVRLLARHGADVNAKEPLRGQTALMWAAAEDHPAVAQALIDLGANVNASSDSDGLERRRDPESKPEATFNPRNTEGGFTPLVFAARQGALETARILVASGANVHETAPAGSSALLFAINNYHYELAAFLVDSGADPGATDPDGYTALHAAVQAETERPCQIGCVSGFRVTGQMDRVAFIRFLIAQGVDLDARLAPGNPRETTDRMAVSTDRLIDHTVMVGGATPFGLAAFALDVEVMRLLVDHGADPQITTVEGTTALALAAGIGYDDRGSDATGRQPPDAQVLQAMTLALDVGNDPNLVNKHGQTPLHGAVYRGLLPAIQLLVDEGASMEAADAVGRTPLKLAEEGYYLQASRLRRDEAAALLARLGNDTPEAARLRRLNPTPAPSGADGTTAAGR